MKSEIYLLLGGNIENRFFYIEKVTKLISKQIGTIVTKSSVYETEPYGFEHETLFLNQVIVVESYLSPLELLEKTQKIEQKLGRKRQKEQYSERTIDVDILFYNDSIINETHLSIPHPRLHERRFVLVPLNEISKNKIHPVFNKSVVQLLNECPDTKKVKMLNNK